MEIKEMTIEELEARKLEIPTELDNEGADLDALEGEVRAINEELESRKSIEAHKAEVRAQVAQGAGEVVEKVVRQEEVKMTNAEIRNSAEYIDAFAEYIKTNDDAECRAVLSENVSGAVPVPDLVADVVRHAWDKEGIMARVKKSYIKGNMKVGFEISADGAVIHTEGTEHPSQETLTMGVVKLVPSSIKKWITISDEALDLDSNSFLEYIYEEVTYQIAKKAADTLIAKINACGTVSTTTCPNVPAITVTTVAMGTIAEALAQLSDEAANPTIMMNKLTWAEFKKVQYANGYGADPFEGLPVEFNNTITAYSAATTGVPYIIVGDLGQGALANFPNGEEITFKFDDLSLAEDDLVKIVGREYVALGVVAPKAFVKVTK